MGGAALTLLGLIACIAWESLRDPGEAVGPIHLVFRFDDYSQRGQESVQEGVLGAFRRHGVPVTVAVIPCPADRWTPALDEPCLDALDESRTQTLVRAHREGVAEIALHGFQHIDAGNRPFESEFSGVDADEQLARIQRGLDEVEARTGVRPVSFVPPFDAYDDATLRAVEALGMQAFSGWLSGLPPSGEALAFLPNSVHILRLREAIEQLNRDPDPGAVLVTIFHPWDLVEADEMEMLSSGSERPLDFARLDALLTWLTARPEVVITTKQALSGSDIDVSEARFAASQSRSRSKLWPLLPPPLSGDPHLALHTSEFYGHLAIAARLRVATYAAAVLVLVAALVSTGLGLLLRTGVPRRAAFGVAVLGLVIALAAPWVMGSLGWKDFAVLLIAAGLALGSLLALAEAGSATRVAFPEAASESPADLA
jgi:peptidoglycan/xylan/chitin deacetylase (PgdA/CDA1 family)